MNVVHEGPFIFDVGSEPRRNYAEPVVLCLQFTFLLDDIGIPQDYRHMEGFGVHTFTLINKAGKVTYVKFHWKPKCGEWDPEDIGSGGC